MRRSVSMRRLGVAENERKYLVFRGYSDGRSGNYCRPHGPPGSCSCGGAGQTSGGGCFFSDIKHGNFSRFGARGHGSRLFAINGHEVLLSNCIGGRAVLTCGQPAPHFFGVVVLFKLFAEWQLAHLETPRQDGFVNSGGPSPATP